MVDGKCQRQIHLLQKLGDQYAGRCVTRISSIIKDFATSPVYWDFTKSGEEGKKVVQKIIEEKVIEAIEVDPHVFELVQYFFAAICYHYKYLDNTLAPRDKHCGLTLFSAAREFKFRAEAKTVFPWTATKYTPQQSGIPPHTMLLVELEKMKMALQQQTTNIIEGLKEELNTWNVSRMQFEANKILVEVS